MSPSYDPATGLLYVVTLEQCDIYSSSPEAAQAIERISRHRWRTDSERARTDVLRALEATSGALRWEYKMPRSRRDVGGNGFDRRGIGVHGR